MVDLEAKAKEFLYSPENEGRLFSLSDVAAQINGGQNFTDSETWFLRKFFNENADASETVGDVTTRWVAI